MKQLKVKQKTKRWSERVKPRSGGRWAVSSIRPAQPVDFRQDKTEMVYSENALSAQFHQRALETPGVKILTVFKVSKARYLF